MKRLLAVSLKAYLSPDQTLAWAGELVSALGGSPPEVDLVVFPDAVMAREVAALLKPNGIAVGLQDVSAFGPGAHTGEIPAEHAALAGLQFAEIGHSERRRELGEDDSMVARKVEAAVAAGLTPFVCVGESERGSAEEAARQCRAQLEGFLHVAVGSPLVVAYEPAWAIGAPKPAPDHHIQSVARAIRGAVANLPDARVVYGGSAGPGLFQRLDNSVDGLFLGRFAHDVRNLVSTIAEITSASTSKE